MNPLYWLDLRMRVREKKLWIVAVFFVVAMFVITAVVLATAFSAGHQRIVPANLGQGLVWAVLYTQAGLLLLLAPLAAAGRIAQEREQRTLPALVNTPISRARIAAGKLWGSWTFVAWLAALALPFLAVGTLWGGSAVPTVVAAVLFNVVIGFVLSSVSLGFSGLFGRSLTAYLVTGAFLFAWVVVVPMLGGLVTALGTLDKEATNLLGYVTWYHHPFAPLALLGSADWRMNTTGILGKLAYCLVVWTLLGLWGIRQATRALKRDVY